MIQKLQQIYDNAYTIYTDAVNSLIAAEKPSEHEVERILDGLLDFCWDIRFLDLFKRLCRYIYPMYPHLVTDYVHFYSSQYEEDK